MTRSRMTLALTVSVPLPTDVTDTDAADEVMLREAMNNLWNDLVAVILTNLPEAEVARLAPQDGLFWAETRPET